MKDPNRTRDFTADEMRERWIKRGREFWCCVYRKRIGPPWDTKVEMQLASVNNPAKALYVLHVRPRVA